MADTTAGRAVSRRKWLLAGLLTVLGAGLAYAAATMLVPRGRRHRPGTLRLPRWFPSVVRRSFPAAAPDGPSPDVPPEAVSFPPQAVGFPVRSAAAVRAPEVRPERAAQPVK
ncbi:hypothetical protein [Actinomadura fibrosa]|uniref:Uncharacterized protein n=1 Tax=Actinomadura fibrosa TaxID=111802 RepID=A0ABW2XNV5_9ACTN|nr:hypothetical protein [Actinomadura fibrosa]